MRVASIYGRRAKLGLIVPPTNTVNEPEWARLLPEGVSLHVMRMPLHLDASSEAGEAALEADMRAAVGELAKARPDVIAYGCTAGSMVSPVDALPKRIGAMAGARGVTTAAAIVAALRALGARRLAVATPYADDLDAHERAFLSENGFEVLRLRGLGIGAGGAHEFVRIATTPLEAVGAHARACVAPGADALLISCTDFPSLPLIDQLEAEFGVPVVSSNTATLWASLRAAGVDDAIGGAGRLLHGP
jgi:maleate isomerase/arylmalonate decarboxylase